MIVNSRSTAARKRSSARYCSKPFPEQKDTMLSAACWRKEDGRWIAEVPQLPGVLAYGVTREAVMVKAEAIALRVLAERLENNETGPQRAVYEPVRSGA